MKPVVLQTRPMLFQKSFFFPCTPPHFFLALSLDYTHYHPGSTPGFTNFTNLYIRVVDADTAWAAMHFISLFHVIPIQTLQAVHIVEPGFQGDWEARTASPTPFPRRQLSPVPSPESTGHDVDQAVEASDDALVNITITAVVSPVGNGVAQDVGVPAPFSAAALANGRVTQQKSAEIYEVANSNILPTLRMEDAADTFAALSAPNGIDRYANFACRRESLN